MTTLTAYQSYRSMSWTTDADKCEECNDVTLAEGSCVVGLFGNYCSEECCIEAEGSGSMSDEAERQAERSARGL